MDQLRIDLTTATFGSRSTRTVNFFINDVPLIDLVRPAELPHAAADGQPHLAGSYLPLIVEDFRDREGLLGIPASTWFEDGGTVLLGCQCGEWGCWPLAVIIDVEDSLVRWHNFRNGHRAWDLSELGPFIFDRGQYEAAAAVLG